MARTRGRSDADPIVNRSGLEDLRRQRTVEHLGHGREDPRDEPRAERVRRLIERAEALGVRGDGRCRRVREALRRANRERMRLGAPATDADGRRGP